MITFFHTSHSLITNISMAKLLASHHSFNIIISTYFMENVFRGSNCSPSLISKSQEELLTYLAILSACFVYMMLRNGTSHYFLLSFSSCLELEKLASVRNCWFSEVHMLFCLIKIHSPSSYPITIKGMFHFCHRFFA